MDELKYISDIDVLRPANTDIAGEGANEIRKLKEAIKNSFPAVTGEVTISSEKLNGLDESIDFDFDNETGETQIILPKYANDDGFINDLQLKTEMVDDLEGGEIERTTFEATIDAGPIGGIQSFPFTQDIIDLIYGPDVFVLAHGQELPDVADPNDRSMYEKIFGIKTIPDLRGASARGHDPRPYADDYLTNDESGRNPDNSALGDFQDDAVGDHEHIVDSNDYSQRVDQVSWTSSSSTNRAATSATSIVDSSNQETRDKSYITQYFVRVN